MNKAPGATDELFVDWGETGQTIGVAIYDAASTLIASRQTGFVESPAGSGGYVFADYVFPDDKGTYRIRYDNDGGTAAVGHVVWEDLTITSSSGEPFDGDTYGEVDEMFRRLKINNPTAEQTEAAEGMLIAATGEIDAEVDREDDDPISGWEISLAKEVCLQRAIELWRASPFGLIDIGGDFGAITTAKNTWDRHAHDLAPLKRQWGLA